MHACNVIMPVYNEEENLPQSLNSLANQTLKPSRVIVVNDGSTDRSLEIINSFVDETYCVVDLRRRNVDPSAFGVGVHYAWVLSQGSKELQEDFDYVGILDADTILHACMHALGTKELVKPSMVSFCSWTTT